MTRDPNGATRAELRRLHEQATPSEWEAAPGQPVYEPLELRWKGEGRIARFEPQVGDAADAALIVAMRNALPALLDEIDAARRFITKHEEHYGPICWRCQVLEERGYCACEIAANE